MTELTRRQLRERERGGSTAVTEIAVQEQQNQIVDDTKVAITHDYQSPPLTRRQLREQSGANPQVASLPKVEANSTFEPSDYQAVVDSTALEAPVQQGRVTPKPPPLPPIGLRRELRQPASDIEHQTLSAMAALDAEIPEQGFRGSNYLGEPSTQSIMLEMAPEAISLSIETVEVFSTGSISILSEPTGSMTGSLDGIDLDSDGAVTGIISTVDPVSARDFIDERSPLGVVPSRVLLKGWWRPWAVGAFSLGMAIAAILASITIFNALGA